jgi:predicted nucleic acid-binding protein
MRPLYQNVGENEAVRIYFNTSALNRPFDALSSERVRLEAEAVVALIAAVEDGRLEWVTSEYLGFEISQDPDRERVQRLSTLLGFATTRVRLSDSVVARARALERFGLRGLDALHVASAEAGKADLLVTTDDRMIRRVSRAGPEVRVRLVGPAEAMAVAIKR